MSWTESDSSDGPAMAVSLTRWWLGGVMRRGVVVPGVWSPVGFRTSVK